MAGKPWVILWAGLLAVGFGGRVAALTGLPDTPDSIRLIHSLSTFDILDFSPQFPGYPLSVALARAVPLEGGLAWSWLQAAAGTLAAFAAAMLVGGKSAGERTAALLLLLSHPFFFIESLRVGTDLLPLPLLYGSLLWLRRKDGSLRGGVLLGLSLGLRPSLFPWLLALVAAKQRFRAGLGALLGIAAWALPTAMVIGGETWLDEGLRFVGGHFSGWGGTAGDGHFGERVGAGLQHWLIAPIAPTSFPLAIRVLLWIAIPFGSVIAIRRMGHLLGPLSWGACGYALWIAVAQHPEHPRHALPLLLPLFALAASGFIPKNANRWQVWGVWLVILGTLLPTTIDLAAAYRRSAPPAWAVAKALAVDPRFDSQLDRIYAADDRAFFRDRGPHWSIGTAFSREQVDADLLSLPIVPRRVWISTRVLAKEGAEGSSEEVWANAQSRDPALCPWGARIGLVLIEERER